MDLKSKKERIEKEFNDVKSRLEQMTQQVEVGKNRLAQLAGQFKLIEELEKEVKDANNNLESGKQSRKPTGQSSK